MTHQDIAEFIGASRETVAFQGSMLTIPSRIALADYAHACGTATRL